MRALTRVNLVAAVMDFGIYALFTAVHHRALDLGAAPVEQALIPVVAGVPYVAVTALGGGLADRVARGWLVRRASVAFAASALGLAATGSLAGLYVVLPLLGVATGAFWPALQASIADRSDRRSLEHHLGRYNVWWSVGKGLGFLAGGAIYDVAGFTGALVMAAATGAVSAGLFPADEAPDQPRQSVEDEQKASASARRAWRAIGRLSLFGAWGAGATIGALYPDLNRELDRSPVTFGAALLTVYAAQAITFVGLRRYAAWHYRAPLFVGLQIAAAIALVALGWIRWYPAILLAMATIGAGLGMCYASALYYALHTDTGRGRSTGFNEAVIGSATFVVPLIGGAVARSTGSIQTPYALAGAVLLLGVAGQLALVVRARGSLRRDDSR